jgi:hypothetical protein
MPRTLPPHGFGARTAATVVDSRSPVGGPLAEYDRRVDNGLLRNDEHQRGEARTYTPHAREKDRIVCTTRLILKLIQESLRVCSICTMSCVTTRRPKSLTLALTC